MGTTELCGRSMLTVRTLDLFGEHQANRLVSQPSLHTQSFPLPIVLQLNPSTTPFPSPLISSLLICRCTLCPLPLYPTAQSRFLVSGSADNTMRLWSVQTGKCLFRWEFPTAVKRVAFNEDDDQVVCITEQRMGHQGAVRIFNINRDGDGTNRESTLSPHPRRM